LLTFDHGLLADQQLIKYVVSKEACFADSTRKNHNTQSVLNALIPLPPIDTAVSPVHLSVAHLEILPVLTLIVAASCPLELTLSMLHILMVFTLVSVRNLLSARLLPDTFTLLHTLHKNARIHVPVSPLVLSISVSFSIVVLTKIGISITKGVSSLPMPQTVLPLTFILITVCPLMDSITVRLVLDPLADIRVATRATPDAVAVLDALDPLAVI
jgi:hypothetical protein